MIILPLLKLCGFEGTKKLNVMKKAKVQGVWFPKFRFRCTSILSVHLLINHLFTIQLCGIKIAI